jgi:hypothetical protein
MKNLNQLHRFWLENVFFILIIIQILLLNIITLISVMYCTVVESVNFNFMYYIYKKYYSYKVNRMKK